MTTILKLKAPNILPAEGMTAIQFKVWKNNLVAYLEQEITNATFFKSGRYEKWLAKSEEEDGRRIKELSDTDDKKVAIQAEYDGSAKTAGDAATRDQKFEELLLTRNAQLSRFLQHIANYSHYTEQDDIVNTSTSLDWIWTYLQEHYNIQTRGSKFLDVAKLVPKSRENPMTFYKQVRARVKDNLRQKGDKIMSKNG